MRRSPFGLRGLKCELDYVKSKAYESQPIRAAWIEMQKCVMRG